MELASKLAFHRAIAPPTAVIIAAASALLLGVACDGATETSPTLAVVVAVHGVDFAFDAPSTIPAGMVTVNFVNDGKALHQAQLVRLDSGRTVADLQAALGQSGPLPRWVSFIGGPNAVDPGITGNATLNLSAGNYALLCVVNVPDGVPHYAKGMIRAFTVSGTGATGSGTFVPAADVTVTLDDYKFILSKPLTAGTHTFEVRNPDDQPHEIELIRLAPGKTVADMLAWLQKPNGPPPRQALGGEAIVAPAGGPVYFTATLAPGDYAFLCFVPDAGDGKPHFMHGMVLAFTIS
ncbi:MAG: hypothetical protein ACR2M1_16865 [Gemmatimonadaceae bacterium]